MFRKVLGASVAVASILAASAAFASDPNFPNASYTPGSGGQIAGVDCGGGAMCPKNASPLSPILTNGTSTLALPATTTAYAANQLVASSATAGSVVVPSFNIATSAGGASIQRLRLSNNDSTGTGWGGVNVQVDAWLVAPTFTNGDRGAWAVATGAANHLATFTCAPLTLGGDGAWTECAPNVGSGAFPKLASGTAIYWTIQTLSPTGVTGASKTWSLAAETVN